MIVFDLRLFQQEMVSQQHTLADAIQNLGIAQHPQPSAAANLPQEGMAMTNGVINQSVLEQAEQINIQ